MEPEVHIVERYMQLVRKCFTMTNIMLGGGKEIDLLAFNPVSGEKFHIEVRIATRGFRLRLIDTQTKSGRKHRRGLDTLNEIKFVHPTVVNGVKEIFGSATYFTLKHALWRTRKRLASKLQNPRLEMITFHTFRHWKATMLYHQTRDLYYVKHFLGHKTLKSTEIYITVEKTIFGEYSDEFNVKVASKPEEIKSLLEAGFDYVYQKDGLMFFRKRK